MTEAQLQTIKPYIISHNRNLEMAADEIAPVLGCTTEQAQSVIDEHEQYLRDQAEMAQWHFDQMLVA